MARRQRPALVPLVQDDQRARQQRMGRRTGAPRPGAAGHHRRQHQRPRPRLGRGPGRTRPAMAQGKPAAVAYHCHRRPGLPGTTEHGPTADPNLFRPHLSLLFHQPANGRSGPRFHRRARLSAPARQPIGRDGGRARQQFGRLGRPRLAGRRYCGRIPGRLFHRVARRPLLDGPGQAIHRGPCARQLRSSTAAEIPGGFQRGQLLQPQSLRSRRDPPPGGADRRGAGAKAVPGPAGDGPARPPHPPLPDDGGPAGKCGTSSPSPATPSLSTASTATATWSGTFRKCRCRWSSSAIRTPSPGRTKPAPATAAPPTTNCSTPPSSACWRKKHSCLRPVNQNGCNRAPANWRTECTAASPPISPRTATGSVAAANTSFGFVLNSKATRCCLTPPSRSGRAAPGNRLPPNGSWCGRG